MEPILGSGLALAYRGNDIVGGISRLPDSGKIGLYACRGADRATNAGPGLTDAAGQAGVDGRTGS